MTESTEHAQEHKTLRQWGQARLAHEATMLADAASVLQIQRAAQNDHRKLIAKSNGIDPTPLQGVDVGVQIGDNSYKQSSGIGGLIKGVILGLVTAGIGGAAVLGLSKFLTPAPIVKTIDKTKDVIVDSVERYVPDVP